jgi:hypothetical protein
MSTQIEMFTGGVSDVDVSNLRAWLAVRDWQTRAEIATGLGWNIRKISAVADLLGTDIIRGQLGFKLTQQLTRDDMPFALGSAEQFISRGKDEIRHGIALKKRLHQMIA